MIDWFVASMVIGINVSIILILLKRHKKQKSVCARCLSSQDLPQWIHDYNKDSKK